MNCSLPETATPEQYERAKMFVLSSKAMGRYSPLQANPGALQGYLYREVIPDYGIFVMPVVLVVVFSTSLDCRLLELSTD